MKNPIQLLKIALLGCFSISAFEIAPQSHAAVTSEPSTSRPETANDTQTDRMSILGFRVVSETPDSLVVDVDYRYGGELGEVASISLSGMWDDARLKGFGVVPASVKKGQGVARITLRYRQPGETIKTNQLSFSFYKGKASYKVFKPYEKTWTGAEPTSAILGFRVVSETPETLVLDVEYKYGGERGPTATMSMEAARKGRIVNGFGVNPGTVKSGQGVSRITLTYHQPQKVETDQLRFSLYKGKTFLKVFKPYEKAWIGIATAPVIGSSASTRPAGNRTDRNSVARLLPRTSRPTPAEIRPSDGSSSEEVVQATKSPQQNLIRRWAIVAAPDVQQTPMPDVLMEELSHEPGVQLVERDEIPKALKELGRSELLSSGSAATRLQLGRLLKADALILLGREKREGDKKELLRLVISETVYGARLWADFFEEVDTKPLSMRISSIVRRVRDRYPDGVKSIIAVPPFVSKNLSHDFNPLRAQFSHVLESALGAFPGIAVLEIEEVQAIRKEQDLTGGDARERIVPVFIEGEFQIRRQNKQERVHLSLRIVRGVTSDAMEWDLAGVPDAVEVLRDQAAARIMQIPQDQLKQTLSVRKQAGLLTERADIFSRRGEFLVSTALRESVLLVDPYNKPQHVRLIDEYLANVPYENLVNWDRIKPGALLENFTLRAKLWERAVEVFEQMVRNGLCDRNAGQRLGIRIRGALDDLIFFRAEDFADGYDAAAAKAFLAIRENCDRTYQRFVRELVPLIGRLKPARRGFDPEKPVDDELLDLALDLDYKDAHRPISTSDLDHYGHVLIDLAADDAIESWFMSRFLFETGTNPDYSRKFSNDDYLAFLGRLNNSGRRINQLYAQLGYLLFDYGYGRQGTKATPEVTLLDLEKWRGDVGLYLHGKTKRYDSRAIRWIEEAITPVNHGLKSPPPLPPRFNEPNPNQKSELLFEPLNVAFRDRNGNAMNRPDSDSEDYWPPYWMLQAGSSDVFWNDHAIWRHTAAGVFQLLSADKTEEPSAVPIPWVYQVIWDGEHLWTIERDGVHVYTSVGIHIVHCGHNEGLPDATAGGRLASLKPGVVVATGSLRRGNRAWCATLTLQGNQIQVDVFHEATIARAIASREHISPQDPRLTFVPYWLYNIGTLDEPRLLLSCALQPDPLGGDVGMSEEYTLSINPSKREVRTALFELCGDDNLATRHLYHFLSNGDALLAYGRDIQLWTAPANRQRGAKAVKTIFSNARKEQGFCGQMFAFGNYVYAPGQQWARVDTRSLTVEPLGEGLLGDGNGNWFGVSSYWGLIGWDGSGTFYKISVVAKSQQSHELSESDAIRNAMFDRDIQNKTGGERPYRHKVMLLLTANKLDDANTVCMAWIKAFPESMTARQALITVQRQIISGLRQYETEQQWSEYPHPTFARWRLFNTPGSSTSVQGALDNAIHLPFATDQTEWYVAELGALDAALLRYGQKQYRRCIEICDAWESAVRTRRGSCDGSYLVVRAAARLRLGEFESALSDAQMALKQGSEALAMAKGAGDVLRAAQAKNPAFSYETDEPRSHESWQSEDR